MLARADAMVLGVRHGKRAESQDDEPTPRQKFLIASPLMQTSTKLSRDNAWENIAPFWAVPKSAPKDAFTHNMELEAMLFEAPCPPPTGGSKMA